MMEKEGLCVKDNPTKGKIRKKKNKNKNTCKSHAEAEKESENFFCISH